MKLAPGLRMMFGDLLRLPLDEAIRILLMAVSEKAADCINLFLLAVRLQFLWFLLLTEFHGKRVISGISTGIARSFEDSDKLL